MPAHSRRSCSTAMRSPSTRQGSRSTRRASSSSARSSSADDLREAAVLYRGDLLEGVPGGGEAFEAWLAGERDRVRATLIEALDRLLGCLQRTGLPREALEIATRLLGIDPCREDLHRTLMRLYAAAGRRSVALRQYQTCVAVLQRELGISPEPETTNLYRAIRNGLLTAAGTRSVSTRTERRFPSSGALSRTNA